jgi:rod shape determining protein RodA
MGVATSTLAATVRGDSWRRFDLQLFLYIVLLIAFGIAMRYSAEYTAADGVVGMTETVKTLIWAAIGFIVFFVVASIDYHWLDTFKAPLYLFLLGALALTLVAGSAAFGAQRSISVAGLDFQFSEIGKVLMIVVLAAFLSGRRERIGRLSTIVIAAALIALPAVLVFRQPDLGTALVFAAILVGMLFMSGAGLGWMGLFAGGLIAAVPVGVNLLHDYQRARLFCFLDPYVDAQGSCYQLVQALNAVGSGGLMGQGLTAGRLNQLNYLPVQTSDFIFTIVAEELGFIGGMVMLALFGLLIFRILVIGWGARDALGSLVAAGLASLILFQLFINVGMVVGIMPVTGIPLPFVSYGGSSLISLLFGLGILQSVRMRSHKPTF